MTDEKRGLRAMFDACPNSAHLTDGDGFTLHWSMTGRGFGSYGFYKGDDGKTHIANEMMGKDDIKRALAIMVDDAVLDDVREPPKAG